jgi:hypothetical protein
MILLKKGENYNSQVVFVPQISTSKPRWSVRPRRIYLLDRNLLPGIFDKNLTPESLRRPSRWTRFGGSARDGSSLENRNIWKYKGERDMPDSFLGRIGTDPVATDRQARRITENGRKIC